MQIDKLNSPQDFFERVLKTNYEDFFNQRSSYQTTINLASSLFHMHEWIFALDKAKAESVLSVALASAHALWQQVELQLPTAGYIRDVANASKHVKLTRQPSTEMTHIANTAIVTCGYGEGAYGVGRYGAPSVMLAGSQGQISFDDCARDVFVFWEKLIAQMYP